MRYRLLTTLLLWGTVGLMLGLGGIVGGKILLIALGALATWELCTMLHKIKLEINSPVCTLAVIIALAGHFFGLPSICASLALIIVMLAHFSAPIGAMPAAIGSVIIITLGLGALHGIYALPDPNSLMWVVWVIAVVKFSDANAYLVGRYLGKHKMAPKISPGKTWEGFSGALIAGIIFGTLGAPLLPKFWLGPVLGIILSAIGSIGDILESALKRKAGVKDSGQILPGIGGFLDLADSLLLTAPIAWLVLWGFLA